MEFWFHAILPFGGTKTRRKCRHSKSVASLRDMRFQTDTPCQIE